MNYNKEIRKMLNEMTKDKEETLKFLLKITCKLNDIKAYELLKTIYNLYLESGK